MQLSTETTTMFDGLGAALALVLLMTLAAIAAIVVLVKWAFRSRSQRPK